MWGGTVLERKENRSLTIFEEGCEWGNVERRAEGGCWGTGLFVFVGLMFCFWVVD